MSKKYYRVIKEHPLWEIGAILTFDRDYGNNGGYHPISDVWVKDIPGVDETWWEGAQLVENQPEWFQRVYEISILGKVKYGTKEAAKAAVAKLFEEE